MSACDLIGQARFCAGGMQNTQVSGQVARAAWENGGEMSQPQTTPRRPRHLMDPANLQPQRRDAMSLSSVQRWVMSVLAATTIEHFAAGLIVAAYFLDDGRPGAQAGLLVVAAVVGMFGVAAAFLIHQRRPLTPWLLAGLVPAIVGAYLIYR